MTGPVRCRRSLARSGEQGSTIPLILGFFILAGLLLTGGVVVSSAFLQLHSLQSACDGAAVAATNAYGRGSGMLDDGLEFDQDAAESAVAAYAQQAWGADAPSVSLAVQVDDDRIVVQCAKVAHVPFEAAFAPDGISQTVTATSRAPLDG